MSSVGTIPEWARAAVRSRSRDRCERCRAPTELGHWHHRRSRSVRDVHTHCPCNGVWLCSTCHAWVHQNPMNARLNGFIVSRSQPSPGTIPVESPWGTRTHDCNGNVIYPSVTDESERQEP